LIILNKSENMSQHAHEHRDSEYVTTGGAKILFPLSILILLAVGAWYLLRHHGVPSGAGPGAHHGAVAGAHHETKHPDNSDAANRVSGLVDSTGNYIYNEGKEVTIQFPGNGGSLKVGEWSTENRLFRFLSDPSATVDTLKGNWFEFTHLRFLSGTASIDSGSNAQLNNIAAIMKAFPAASFKMGGYTDNTGDSVKNMQLSQQRADAVMNILRKLQVPAAALVSAKGYGPAFPLGDNATPEGRAMNRRVAINVKSK
jgi:outer membrane protein OmpA-like peptidoglycan-associated protein